MRLVLLPILIAVCGLEVPESRLPSPLLDLASWFDKVPYIVLLVSVLAEAPQTLLWAT